MALYFDLDLDSFKEIPEHIMENNEFIKTKIILLIPFTKRKYESR